MSNAGIPLRVIQKISGHHSLDVLQEYLEITLEQVRGAASSLSMLGYSDHNASTRPPHLDLEESWKNEHREDKQQAEWEFYSATRWGKEQGERGKVSQVLVCRFSFVLT